jgi:hypothetical protein
MSGESGVLVNGGVRALRRILIISYPQAHTIYVTQTFTDKSESFPSELSFSDTDGPSMMISIA